MILGCGYDKGGFNGRTCTIMTNQSEHVDGGARFDVDALAGEALDQIVVQDNATVFGYACDHTPAMLPLPIWLAHRAVRRLDAVRKNNLTYLAPDGRCQVGVLFENHRPLRIDAVTLIASQEAADQPGLKRLRRDLREQVIEPAFNGNPAGGPFCLDNSTRITINPEGAVIEGGPTVHAGLTGRKNGIDTYGDFSRQSGAALSGKDPSRIDRVGAYAARHAAKNVVAARLARRCEVQLSYSIGFPGPVSIRVETFGSGAINEAELQARVKRIFDFRLGAIVKRFRLRHRAPADGDGFFQRLAAYGHVGRDDLDLPWEALDAVGRLRES
jgi:S-adenosylmethionine synthetase